MYFIQGFTYFIIILLVNYVTSDENGKCNWHNVTTQMETDCIDCDINMLVSCPQGTKKLTTMEGNHGCSMVIPLDGLNLTLWGCSHTCEMSHQVYNCCSGYWGPQCDECPGGYNSSCNGHGICNDTLTGNGLCTCDPGWSGYSCEFCVDPILGGEKCNQDSIGSSFELCGNLTCPNNSRCVVIDNEALCICTWPYVEHDEDTANHTAKIVCIEINPCTIPPLCHQNATCERSPLTDISGIEKNCTCNNGFHGDGYKCDAIDLCQKNNGGCDEVSTTCVYVDAGNSKCVCKDGYEPGELTLKCELIDVCASENTSCDARATCTTVGPNHVNCQCPDGYIGDGHSCYGNVVQTIKDLNEFDPDLKDQLTLILRAIEKYYYTELTQHGPFTMFVPVDEGFRNVDNPDFQEWLEDSVRIRQIIRQHIIVGKFLADNLTDVTFYTLQGSSAVLRINWKAEYRYRIQGANRKGKILKRDVMASNGIIHVITKLMINDPHIQVYEMSSIYGNIQVLRYNTFRTLVDSFGTEINGILKNENVTLFVPNNSNLEDLPRELLDHLTSLKGSEQLKGLLMNHIFPGRIEITDLINRQTLTSINNVTNSISVASSGQVILNEEVSIQQTDMPATNGLIHDIHGLLLTNTMSVYPNRCQNDSKEQGEGCCAGFYGPDCLLCPGGFTNPCNGHGTCDDGINGSGNCTCDQPFAGNDCKSCIHNRWGENCDGECSCVHGDCWGGCKCHEGYTGNLCDQHVLWCGDELSKYYNYQRSLTCHIHAECIVLKKDTYRCICKPGYQGTGHSCTEIDPCLTNRGGCHLQATCLKTGPGTSECQCNNGFKGNGYYCYQYRECTVNSDCHQNARCIYMAGGKYVCHCLDGFHGNGTSCWYDDKCKINNGGCHTHAKCTHDDKFNANVSCTCYSELGYYGDGLNCKPSILKLIQDDPRLSQMAEMIKSLKDSHVNLNILKADENTVFAFTNKALDQIKYKLIITVRGEYDVRVVLRLLKGHTIQGKHSLNYLAAVSNVTQLHSLLPGFSYFISKGMDGKYYLMLRRTGKIIAVVEHDLDASNGYLNIVNEVLLPMSSSEYARNGTAKEDIEAMWKNLTDHNMTWTLNDPTLTDYMKDRSNYSMFMNSLTSKNLTAMLEKDDFPFTLFVPSNKYMQNINRTVTRDFLRYYIVPEVAIIWSSFSYNSLITDLGSNHQLEIRWVQDKLTVNGVPVVKHDIFVDGGVINLIDGLLHPVLNWCNIENTHVEMGPCTVCDGNMFTCLSGLTPLVGANVIPCSYSILGANGTTVQQSGCQGPCFQKVTYKGCCDGHYGKTCRECPGGPEFPCNDHGQCDTGITGSGKCNCESTFKGDTCDSCISGFTGPNCDIDMSGCAYKNGGCHEDANCSRGNSDVISCACKEGFSGNGYNCTGPCDSDNGGCHSNAKCTYSFQTGVMCECKATFVGDGKTYCMSTLYSSLASVPNTSLFYKSVMSLSDQTLVKELNSDTSEFMFVIFVPKDDSLNSMMSEDTVLQQIVRTTEVLILNPVDFTNVSLYTLSNQTVLVSYDPSKHTFYVNKTKVIQGNIKFTNGIVHIVEGPFTPPIRSSESDESSAVGPVVGTVICLLLVGLIVTAVIVIYRQSKSGYWSSLNKWLVNRETSAFENAPLHEDEEDSQHHDGGLSETKFDNPAFISDSE